MTASSTRGTLTWTSFVVAQHRTRTFFRRPELFLPVLIMPIVFLIAFAGPNTRLADIPGFDYPLGYTAFQWVYAFTQGAVLAGAFVGIEILRDFDSGLFRRLLLAVSGHRAIVLGLAGAATIRIAVAIATITVLGLVIGVRPTGNPGHLVIAVVLVFGYALNAALWSLGLAMRLRNLQAALLVQIPLLVSFFVGPSFVPTDLLGGWVRDAAAANPSAYVLTAVRDLFVGRTDSLPAAAAIVAILLPLSAIWTFRGLRSAEHAGGEARG